MIAILPLLLLGGVAFVEQPIDDLAVFDDEGLDNKLARTWRCADIDGDGAKDILTPNGVAFQRDGQFPKTQQTPFPSLGERSRADVWGNEIYVLLQDRIEVLRWSQGDWQRTLSQPITWNNPPGTPEWHQRGLAGNRPPNFTRFLYDIDVDGKPEIVVASADGLRVYAKGNLFYEEKALWPVLPRLKPVFLAQTVWPATARGLEMPWLASSAWFQLDKHAVTVYTRETVGVMGRPFDRDLRSDDKGHTSVNFRGLEEEVVFKQSRYKIEDDNSFALSEQPESVNESGPISNSWAKARLNDDAVMDFVRVRYEGSTTSPYPVAIYEVAASTDGGKTFHTAQCTGAYPRNVLADFNQDGRLDLVTESKQLVEGGLKETLVRGFTRREVDLDVEVRLQDDNGGFPAKPSIRRRFTVTLDKPPAKLSEMFLRFLKGGFLQLGGDVDGDGQCDAVIHDRPDSLSVYRGSSTAITNSHIASLSIAPTGVFHVIDIDEDGRADVLIGRASGEHNESASATVYLSRETAR
jgi:hypothetical protein